MSAHESIAKALDLKDAVAAHSTHGQPFEHHQHAAEAEEVREMVRNDVDAQFDGAAPDAEALRLALERKDKLAEHGVKISQEEEAWREEVDQAIK